MQTEQTAAPHDTAALSGRLKAIIEYVRDCQARVYKGEIMDLQGLDRSVIDVCNAIAALPENEGKKMESQMSTLIDSLEVLAGSIKEMQDTLIARGGR